MDFSLEEVSQKQQQQKKKRMRVLRSAAENLTDCCKLTMGIESTTPTRAAASRLTRPPPFQKRQWDPP